MAGWTRVSAPRQDYSIFDALAQCKAAGTCSPTSVSVAKYFYPNTGFTASATDPALIDFDFNNRNREENLVAKTDYVLNAQNTFSARFIYANTTEVEEDAEPIAPEFLSTASPITQVFGLGWVWTPNARWVNELRFSYNSFNEAIAPVDHNVNPTTYGINTGVTDPRLFGMPRINPSDGLMNYLGGNSSWPLDTTPSGRRACRTRFPTPWAGTPFNSAAAFAEETWTITVLSMAAAAWIGIRSRILSRRHRWRGRMAAPVWQSSPRFEH